MAKNNRKEQCPSCMRRVFVDDAGRIGRHPAPMGNEPNRRQGKKSLCGGVGMMPGVAEEVQRASL